MVKWAMVAAMVVVAHGCSGDTQGTEVDPSRAQVINAAVAAAAEAGCAMIDDKESAGRVVRALESAVAVNPADAWNMLNERAQQPPLAYIWAALHTVIDPVRAITPAVWVEYARGAIRSAARGCSRGLGTIA